MWFKKKSVLQAENHYDTEKSADGLTDVRTSFKRYVNSSSSINSGLPSVADANNYFYLPALGSYFSDKLEHVGDWGYYWSSSANPALGYDAYNLYFDSGVVVLGNSNRTGGYRTDGAFE